MSPFFNSNTDFQVGNSFTIRRGNRDVFRVIVSIVGEPQHGRRQGMHDCGTSNASFAQAGVVSKHWISDVGEDTKVRL